MGDAHVEVPEDGEPRIAGRRLSVLSVVLTVGGTDVTIEEYAEEHELDVSEVTAALAWAATREEWMASLIEERAMAMEQAMDDRDYPVTVDAPPGLDAGDVADYRRRAMEALSTVVSDWRQYGDTRWGDREK
ncbi:DUF433 domain-containing protein [Halopenitus persicus]|uniref:DUF433 domain-containing protein n=1 Tax=Halopenitus persicus TaxID=1048396 RepID=UPI000BBA5411|nr:DUF433 domain-containing protein [Halopenitus persicus]